MRTATPYQPQVSEPDPAPAHAIDPTRVVKNDPEARDAIWVPVVGNSIDAVTGIDAKHDATRFCVEHYSHGDAYDKEFGPFLDDGQIRPTFSGADSASAGTTSVEEYRQMQARQNSTPRDRQRYVIFYRIRRNALA